MDIYISELSYRLSFYVYDNHRWITETILDKFNIPYNVYEGYGFNTVRYNTRWSLPWCTVKQAFPWCLMPHNSYPTIVCGIDAKDIDELEPLEEDPNGIQDAEYEDDLNRLYSSLNISN